MSKDTIYREDAIEAIHREARIVGGSVAIEYADMFQDAIKALPSADRPQGEWIDMGKNLWKCSNCGMVIYSESEQDRNEFHKWCSRCGASMKGADDE